MLTSSLADTVMVHLAEQVAPGIDVLFLDTGYHFAETIGTRDAVAAVHDVNLITLTPAQTVAEQDATWGKDLFASNPDQCCALRKTAAAGRGAGRATPRGRAACVGPTRRPREDADRLLGPAPQDRQDRPDRHLDRRRRRRLHRANGLMINPLLEDGYPSIGCEPCTSRATAEDPRGGRWAGLAKTECGIHL